MYLHSPRRVHEQILILAKGLFNFSNISIKVEEDETFLSPFRAWEIYIPHPLPHAHIDIAYTDLDYYSLLLLYITLLLRT